MLGLPTVLDIAIGLVFIYLILSLLASEIQEVLATVFQWRATHLRKSVEILLTGGEATSDPEQVKDVKVIVRRLYNNPLIKNINQQSSAGLRPLLWRIGRVFNRNSVYSKSEPHTQPSYIPAETFATTLLDQLKLPALERSLTYLNLRKFIQNELEIPIFQLTQHCLTQHGENANHTRLEQARQALQKRLQETTVKFKTGRLALATTLLKIDKELENYRIISEQGFSDDQALNTFLDGFKAIQHNVFDANDQNNQELLQHLRPNFSQIIELLSENNDVCNAFYQEMEQVATEPDSPVYQAYQEVAAHVERLIDALPASVRQSLAALALRAQIRAENTQKELQQFQTEVERWFDHSMDRASGVYKRNAKGVAFLIGLGLAIATNADTLNMVSSLATDGPVRQAIIQNAGAVLQSADSCPGARTASSNGAINANDQAALRLACLRENVSTTLETNAMPIGWTAANLDKQMQWQFDPAKPLNHQAAFPIRRALYMLLGWVVSGLAISMGASFWFDLLSKVINVRNTGIKPSATPERSDRS